MRRLSPDELVHGLYAKCKPNDNETLYQFIEVDGVLYYTCPGSFWKSEVALVTSVWWETPITRGLNRESKLGKLGI